MALNSRQRAYLRSLAHHLKPVMQIGSGGVTAAVCRSVEEAFATRELLKVKVLAGAPDDARDAAEQLVAGVQGAEVIQTIGKTVVLFRPDPDEPEIRLPR